MKNTRKHVLHILHHEDFLPRTPSRIPPPQPWRLKYSYVLIETKTSGRPKTPNLWYVFQWISLTTFKTKQFFRIYQSRFIFKTHFDQRIFFSRCEILLSNSSLQRNKPVSSKYVYTLCSISQHGKEGKKKQENTKSTHSSQHQFLHWIL